MKPPTVIRLPIYTDVTGLGNVSAKPAQGNAHPQAVWRITAQAECRRLVEILERYPMRARKARDFAVWAAAVDLLGSAITDIAEFQRLGMQIREVRRFAEGAGFTVPEFESRAAFDAYLGGFVTGDGHLSLAQRPGLVVKLRSDERPLLEAIHEYLRWLVATRQYTRTDWAPRKPPPPGRRCQVDPLEALRAWAATEGGELSVNRYVAARRLHAEWPTRNTIANRFGSWHAALEAAGLADRAATDAERHARREAGTQARRAQQREASRALMLDGVWRRETGLEIPTQATMYKLFEGGWPEVLRLARDPVRA